MTSGSTFPQRLSKIDDLTRPDHSYLEPNDVCYFMGEYTARKGYAFSATNNLILNFKKKMDRRGQSDWRWKQVAINQAAAAIRAAMDVSALNGVTFIPVPPSRAKGDPLYDDRLTQMLRLIRPAPPLDIRELLIQCQSTAAAHESTTRPSPTDLQALYTIEASLTQPTPNQIVIVDDVLTTGSHFCAAKAVLTEAFPQAKVIGLFLARRVPESDFNVIDA